MDLADILLGAYIKYLKSFSLDCKQKFSGKGKFGKRTLISDT